MKHLVVSLALLISLFTRAQQPAFVTDSLSVYMQREMAAWGVPGAAVAIVKDGKVVVCEGYGVREQGKPAKVNNETVFQIASCSKAFTTTSLALLEQQKKLSLDDKVNYWLKGFRLYDDLATQEVTIRDLVSNRIGLKTFQGDFAHWGSNFTRKEMVEKMRVHEPQFGFRAGYGYCNVGFLTAGEIIPLAAGMSWDEFVRVNFFGPLNMKRSSTQYKDIVADTNAAKPHTWWEKKQIVVPYDNIDNLGPAGSISSCVKDLANWLLFQLDSGKFNGKQVVPFSVLKETRKPQTIIENTNPNFHFLTYCLGWFSADYQGKQMFWHGGAASGFLSNVTFIPELGLGIVVLTNNDQNQLYNNLRMQIIDAYMNLPYKNYSQLSLKRFLISRENEQKEVDDWRKKVAEKKPLPVSAQSFTGTYENPVYGRMVISMTDKNKKMIALFEHHPNIYGTLEYMGDSTFLCSFSSPLWGIKPAPFLLKNGEVESITIHIADFVDSMPYVFRKVSPSVVPSGKKE